MIFWNRTNKQTGASSSPKCSDPTWAASKEYLHLRQARMTNPGIQHDVPLAPLTTLGLGGSAKYFVRARDERALCEALRWATNEGVSCAILGGGSNLIVPDEGYDGLVIQIGIDRLAFEAGGLVDAGAGVPWELVVEGAVSRGWAGLECLTGIPGSTGATPIQNVGAYGQEVAEVVQRVRVLRRDTLRIEELAPKDCHFGYRDSVFKHEPERSIVWGYDLPSAPTVRAPSATRSFRSTSARVQRSRTSAAPCSSSEPASPWSSTRPTRIGEAPALFS